MKQSLGPTQTPNIIAIQAKIQQLHTEIRAAVSVLLVIPMPETITKAVVDLFVDESPLCASRKRPCLNDNNPDAMR